MLPPPRVLDSGPMRRSSPSYASAMFSTQASPGKPPTTATDCAYKGHGFTGLRLDGKEPLVVGRTSGWQEGRNDER